MTDTSPAVADDETWSVTRTIRIDAPRSTVWAALTTPDLISRWFDVDARFDRVEIGAAGVFATDSYGDIPVRIDELQPETAFGYRWGTPGEPLRDDNSTLARFTLADEGDATLVSVVETGFSWLTGTDEHRRSILDEHRRGWDAELDNLVAFLDRP
jgi:uncharacterized protein YndB with AHSA1/START domain